MKTFFGSSNRKSIIRKCCVSLRNQLGYHINPLSANPSKWSNTLNQFVGKLPTNWLSVFDHFEGLALKRLRSRFYSSGTENSKDKTKYCSKLSFLLFARLICCIVHFVVLGVASKFCF